MPRSLLNETFDADKLHPLLNWTNPPSRWRLDSERSCLIIEPDAKTDFWQKTHYGFQADNGHFLSAEVTGDAIVTAKFRSFPVHQYDQVGLLVRFSQDSWLKSSVEFEDGIPSQLGTVVTNHGYSDWSLEDFPYGDVLTYCLRIRRVGEISLLSMLRAKKIPGA